MADAYDSDEIRYNISTNCTILSFSQSVFNVAL